MKAVIDVTLDFFKRCNSTPAGAVDYRLQCRMVLP